MVSLNPQEIRTATGKIIAIHVAYESRAAQRGRRPTQPSYFLKPTSSLSFSGDSVERPEGTELMAFEGEIALIIGKTARNVPIEEAWSHVGYVTASNDLGVYDYRAADKGSNLRSKGRDGYTPIGPELIDASKVSPENLRIRTWVDGELRQEDTTAARHMIFPLEQFIADLSQHMTLEPGDIILTGTPAGSSVVTPGQTVEIEVDAPEADEKLSSGRLITDIIDGLGNFNPEIGALPSIDDKQREEAWGSREEAGLSVERNSPTSCAPNSKKRPLPDSPPSSASADSTTSSSKVCIPRLPVPQWLAPQKLCASSPTARICSRNTAVVTTPKNAALMLLPLGRSL